MPNDVYIDNDVFDFLFERKLDLAVELPCGEYCLFLTREAEFEIPSIPKPQLMLREPGCGRHTGHGDPLLHCLH